MLIAAPFWLRPYGIYILSLWAVMTIAAIGLNLTLGYAGQISLAQGAFVGIGAYVAALLTTQGWPLCSAYRGRRRRRASGRLAARLSGAARAAPLSRLRDARLLTLLYSSSATRNGSPAASTASPTSRARACSAVAAHAARFYYFCLANLALVSLAAWWLIRSPWGRAFVALRENPMRALSLGVDTRRYTLMAFAIGAGLGGISGVLYAPLVQFIDPTPFALALSLNLLLMVIVGGSGYFFGPFLGAIVAVLLPEWLQSADRLYDALGRCRSAAHVLPPDALNMSRSTISSSTRSS